MSTPEPVDLMAALQESLRRAKAGREPTQGSPVTTGVPERWVELGAGALTGGVNYAQPGDPEGFPGMWNRITAATVLHPVLTDLRRQVKTARDDVRVDMLHEPNPKGRDHISCDCRDCALVWAYDYVLDLLATGGSDG